ncbi:MAG TPA: helix-turn-helix domain-containing protein [Streptosporangiaceae bacterium]|nr:helix-turn-helix domain-containing protein [Streptosporangiaceae bacterium]
MRAPAGTAEAAVSLAFRPRSPLLAPYVRSIGFDMGPELPTRHERIVPSGGVSLMINLHEDEFRVYHGPEHAAVHRVGGAMLAGPRTRAIVIDTAEQRCVVTVSFTTGGAAPFFAEPLTEARDLLVDLTDLWGRHGAALRERLLAAPTPPQAARLIEAALVERAATAPAAQAGDPDDATAAAVARAAAAFDRGASVSEVAGHLGLLPKRFTRMFAERTGLTPKRFSRLRRLQRLLGDVHDRVPAQGAVNWAEIAAAHGYFDQAHLINDFRAITGITPAAYLAAVGDAPNHVPVARGP